MLSDISLKVKEKEVVALIGSNCAGKSTLLKTISGLLRPSSGSIEFQEKRIDNLLPHEITKLGISYVPEGRRLFPNMTVLENLELGAYVKEAREKKEDTIDLIFQLFPVLKERASQLACTLSGGEQQMLAIGRALMARPKLLLIDEPSLGLAPIVVQKLFNTLKELNMQGITIMLAEQNVPMSLKLAHRGYLLESGKIVLEGTGEELLQHNRIKSAYLGI